MVEIVHQQGDYVAVSDPVLTVTDGYIGSFDADSNGNLWVNVSRYDDVTSEWSSELYKIDDESRQRVNSHGLDLQTEVQTRFDNQGNTWVMTDSGDVVRYDGKEWETIVDEGNSPYRELHSMNSGFYEDKKGRLWLWQNDRVHLLNDGKWTTFTEENSGLRIKEDRFGSVIFGVVVDDLDRLWVASESGVTMVPFDFCASTVSGQSLLSSP